MTRLLQYFCNLLSGLFPLILLIICGFYITFKGEFFQFSRFFEALGLVRKAVCSKREKHKGITSFQAACTALSATVGTGNIAGVAGAISIGGAGAVFWMWISAFLGMAVKFCEVALAIHFREKKGENYLGGPIYYMKKGVFGSYPYLHIVAVKEDCRCFGIGRQLMNYFEENASDSALTKYFLTVDDFNPRAKKLYENLGYHCVGELPDFYKKGVNCYLMMKVRN